MAARSDKGDGRVYNIRFFADDGLQRCKGNVEVRVPYDKQSKDCRAMGSGQYYDATGVSAGSCVSSDTAMCLNKGRFKVEVAWKAQDGRTGVGKAVPCGSDDSGMFWFFQGSNWEMLIKVLDGCGINNRYWVFFAATTDQEFTVTVTDTKTGQQVQYTNPLKTPADAVTDTDAFATCP